MTDEANTAETSDTAEAAEHRDFRDLDRERYITLETFRKTGKGVATPVWFTCVDDALVVFTASDSGKVKRLRNFSRSRVAPCTATGKPTGPFQPTSTVFIEDAEEITKAHRALRKKYGWQMMLTDFGSRLTGRIHRRAFLAIHPRDS